MRDDRPRWVQPAPYLWSASHHHDFFGLVELLAQGYVAVGWQGEDLGTYRSLESAQEAVAEHARRSSVRALL